MIAPPITAASKPASSIGVALRPGSVSPAACGVMRSGSADDDGKASGACDDGAGDADAPALEDVVAVEDADGVTVERCATLTLTERTGPTGDATHDAFESAQRADEDPGRSARSAYLYEPERANPRFVQV